MLTLTRVEAVDELQVADAWRPVVVHHHLVVFKGHSNVSERERERDRERDREREREREGEREREEKRRAR